MANKMIAFGIAGTIVAGSLVGGSNTYASSFTDIHNHWAQSTITAAIKDGYAKGYEDGTFKPNGSVTRAEFASMLTRGVKAPEGDYGNSFSDIPQGHWASESISKAAILGFINPEDYSDGKFAPNTVMTRFEMAQWFSNGLVKSDPSFALALKEVEGTILPFTEFYRNGFSKKQVNDLSLMLGTGVISGYVDGSFGGNRNVTRAETISMLYRYLAVEGQDATQYRELNELREVGMTGTNLVAMTDYEYDDKNVTFNDIWGKSLQLNYDIADLKLYHVIVIDLYKDAKYKSVYTNMFGVEDNTKMVRVADRTHDLRYVVYTDFALTTKEDAPETMAILNSTTSRVSNISPMPSTYGSKYGYSVLDYKDAFNHYKAGQTVRAWAYGTGLGKLQGDSDTTTAIDGSEVYIGIPVK